MSSKTDPIWQRDEIESPCIQICVMHPDEKICTGCYRSIEEITRWSQLPTQERSEIMQALPNRAKSLKKRRGGRAAKLNRR